MSKFAGILWSLATLQVLLVSVGCDSKVGTTKQGGSDQDLPVIIRYPSRPSLVSADLAASPGGGPSLFEAIDATQAGMDFLHRWELRKETVYLFDRVEAGGGVTVADVDNDGKPDVYLTRPLGGGRLYRNLGGFRFEDMTEEAGLSDQTILLSGGAFADIDNDGDFDLTVCSFGSPTRLYVNDGAGRFVDRAAELGFNFKGSGIMVSYSDYDRDGDLDGFLATNRYAANLKDPRHDHGPYAATKLQRNLRGEFMFPPELEELWGTVKRSDNSPWIIRAGQRGRLFRNDGGRFSEVGLDAGLEDKGMTISATWWDHNGDGWPDLYIANDFMGPDRLYENQQDGTFRDVAPEVLPHVPWYSMGSDVGDLNNDGREDFIATDMAGSTHYKSKLAMGDMDKFAWFLESGAPRQYMRNAVYLNTGSGRKMEVAQQLGLDASDWTWAPKFGDFDCDGWLDIFISNGMTADLFNSDSRRQTKLGVSIPFSELEPKRDFNMAFRNLGNLSFENVGEKWGLSEANASFGTALADLDGDGDLDIIVNRFKEPVALYRNSSGGGRIKVALYGRYSNSRGLGATVTVTAGEHTQARTLTSSRGVLSTNEPALSFGIGEALKVERLVVRWPSGHEQTFSDLNEGRRYEVTEPSWPPPDLDKMVPEKPAAPYVQRTNLPDWRHQELPFNDFEEQPLLPNRMSRLGPGAAVADIDGDGDEDVYMGGARDLPGVIFRRAGDGWELDSSNTVVFSTDRPSEDMGALFFDVEGDGDADLVVVSGGVEASEGDRSYRDRLYLNDGTGKYQPASREAFPGREESGSCVVAGDYDQDGDLDLFIGGRVVPGKYPLAPPSRLFRNDSTSQTIAFREVTDEVAPDLLKAGMVTSALWSDVDCDQDVDLLLTREWGAVGLYRNDGGRLIKADATSGVGSLAGWWNGIAGGDVDGDGDMDYAVSNFGLNTKYRPTREHPVVLYYGDFEGTGEMRIVEAKETAAGAFPVRGFSCSSGAIKSLVKKLDYDNPFHDFAIRNLTALYTRESLDKALRLEVNELRSGILLNDGFGSFRFMPLPALAQNSPGFGLQFFDANRDRHPDLYMVQNFHGPQPETGRMHGGLSMLLAGRGDGRFEPIWPQQSGLMVPGDAKSLVVLEDGDFLLSQNDEVPLLFSPRSGGASRCALRLRGKPGNPDAVGARVTLTSAEGDQVGAYEVHAGSGYLGGSSTALAICLGETSAQPVKVDVSWPDGQQSSHDLSGNGRHLISQP